MKERSKELFDRERTASARAAGTAHDDSRLHVPARDGAQVLAQDADIVRKLGCRG